MVDGERLGVTMTEIVKSDRPDPGRRLILPPIGPETGKRMHILIIGSLSGPLGQAAGMAKSRGVSSSRSTMSAGRSSGCVSTGGSMWCCARSRMTSPG